MGITKLPFTGKNSRIMEHMKLDQLHGIVFKAGADKYDMLVEGDTITIIGPSGGRYPGYQLVDVNKYFEKEAWIIVSQPHKIHELWN